MSKGSGDVAREGLQPCDAADWFVENESDREPDRNRLSRWERWSASEENRSEYTEVVRMHEEIRSLAPPPAATRQELLEDAADDPDVTVVFRRKQTGVLRKAFGSGRHALSIHSRIGMAGTWLAAMLLLTVGGAFLFRTYPLTFMNPVKSYVTAPGEQREFALPDGSKVTLGGDTKLALRFAANARVIELDRGEAFFRVEHDRQRPFVVHAAGGTTTAVGTAFEVRRYEKRVQVWVREGAVVVAPLKTVAIDTAVLPDPARLTPVRLARGEEMSYDSNGEATVPRPADPRVTAAWTDGHLVPLIYHGRPLPEVIEDIQPYTRRRIVLDPAAADLLYSGIVKQEDIGAWIQDLGAIYPVDIIDCRMSSNRSRVMECSDSERIVIRSHLNLRREVLKSVQR